MLSDRDYLLQALKLAQIRQGFCFPNPAVGCVIVKNNKVITEGYHQGPGTAHAERMALNNNIDVSGATAYVTLVPCCHHGRTPPCTDILIEKKIARVVYGFNDPNPLVKDKSPALLKNCEYLPQPEINHFYRAYAYWWQHKKPWVTVKIAQSLDGKITYPNQTTPLTGEAARLFTHQQRLQHDAILTGINTILIDDPALNVRLQETIAKPVIILDSKLRLPKTAKILTTAASLMIFYNESLTEIPTHLQKFECIPTSSLTEILSILGHKGFHQIWVEAGATIANSFIQQNLWQTFYLYIAPKILGETAVPALQSFPDFQTIHWQQLGEDGVCRLEQLTSW